MLLIVEENIVCPVIRIESEQWIMNQILMSVTEK